MDEGKGFFEQLSVWYGIGVKAFLLFGIAIILVYLLRLAFTRNSKKKYNFINLQEIKSLKWGMFFIVLSMVFLMNDQVLFQFEKYLSSDQSNIFDFFLFIGGFFVMLIIGILIYSGLRSILDIYYSNYIGRRLENIRYSPRTSEKTGNKMELLNEEKEDVYLTESMQKEEELLKYDYDVWRDEQTGDIQIEKYIMHDNTMICPECKFRTFKSVGDKLVSTLEGNEVLQRDFECSFCGHIESKLFKVTNHIEMINGEIEKLF